MHKFKVSANFHYGNENFQEIMKNLLDIKLTETLCYKVADLKNKNSSASSTSNKGGTAWEKCGM